MRGGFSAIEKTIAAISALGNIFLGSVTEWAEQRRERKLILAIANPTKASTDFSNYKESSIESRTIVDSRGRVLAQVKLWIYLDTRQCFREFTFLNTLLRTSVGLNRLSFNPLHVGVGDTPAALIEVSVRELEAWLKNRTVGTQFGVESVRAAVATPFSLKVASLPAPIAQVVPIVGSAPATAAAPAPSALPVVSPPARQEIKAKVEEFSRGILEGFGIQNRITGDRSFDQYCVDITLTEGDSRGMIKRLWGADLQRVVEESRANVGHRVEIQHHGSMPVANRSGGSSYKNNYSLQVLK